VAVRLQDRWPRGDRWRRLGCLVVLSSVLASAGCGNKPQYYQGDIASIAPGTRVAVLPLVNFSREERAPDIVGAALVVELLATNRFTVVDPGLVEQAVLDHRLRLTDRLPLETLQKVGKDLGVEYVFVGSVNEFAMVPKSSESVPTLSFALRMVQCSTGVILWAATHSKRGDDAESMFELGRVETLEELSAVAAREVAETFKKQ
jgi:TolB-like protein